MEIFSPFSINHQKERRKRKVFTQILLQAHRHRRHIRWHCSTKPTGPTQLEEEEVGRQWARGSQNP
jgi:hypothetical protein